MHKIFTYLVFGINIMRYKFKLKESKSFFIKSNSYINGLKMISIGKSFFANNFLRIEVFGDNSKIKLKIGNSVSLGEFVHIAVNNFIEIKDNVLIGSRVLITDHNHGNYTGDYQSSPFEPPIKRAIHSSGPIIINENVWIGDGVVILPNVEIGFGTIIAANSVVTKSLPGFSIAGGIPCKVLKTYNADLKLWTVKNQF